MPPSSLSFTRVGQGFSNPKGVPASGGQILTKVVRLVLLNLFGAWSTQAWAAIAPHEAEFFESKVRPVLVERCYECHGEKKQKNGLRLDSLAGWQEGGDTGPALVPGNPEDSLLIKAIRYTDPDFSMPPKKKLSDDEIAVLTEWVKRGAPDPRTGPAASKKFTGMTLDEARSYWAFQPLRPTGEEVRNSQSSSGHPIDAFILAKLKEHGLHSSPRAEPRVLVRRLYFDLIGSPPSFEEVEKFARNPSREAFAQLVDELLLLPEYGQRWGRHWLDVARYSDTTEKSTEAERRIPFAHTYRDYVIEAFNADKPFDRFVLEQIAADRMPAEEKPDLRALGFLTLGRIFEGNVEAGQLIIDDRIDVIGRGLLGLTLACARCHDHKFDAIPTADYYSLYGILGSSVQPFDLPAVSAPAGNYEVVQKYRAERAQLLADYESNVDAALKNAQAELRTRALDHLRYLAASSPNHRTVAGELSFNTPRGPIARGGPVRWEALIAGSLRAGEKFFQLWSQLMGLPRERFAEQAKAVLAQAAACPESHDPLVLAGFHEQTPGSMLEVADLYGGILSEALKSPDEPATATLRARLDAGLRLSREEVAADLLITSAQVQIVTRAEAEKANGIRAKLTKLEAGAPIERAQVLSVSSSPLDARVLIRGERTKLGPQVPRRFLQALADVDARTYAGDGRLELAQAIASEKNPLTARVIVNRVWQHHFGHGLVATPDNFGAVAERPSHPELLDHLAAWFIGHGWSLKALHRYILSSATWQQSGAIQPLAMEKDPANRLLWRMVPRRLEFEPLRDSLLQVAGRLDTRLGGRSAPLDDGNVRRAVYGTTDRFRIPALLRNFDVANPDQSISRRAETIHPLQALYFLNSRFVRTQAEAVLKRPEIAGIKDTKKTEDTKDTKDVTNAKKTKLVKERIAAVYRRVLSRQPDAEESVLAASYLGNAPVDSSGARQWADFVQGLLLSNEFSFYD